ncbi:toll/interleukin-1 receptor domain-containing protein [Micropruina sonneratiae]|uniref:toll/interleukin-1 receptor domain-containing protein n=1 Tax=Micropruina sonneratiae TaxID=2986940 RepID=UPI002226AAE5|nr:toll/interleukin-1 receptor domain-containing protein [Micropruina sp. KQZ13P-5]MCW3158629.1 toll/interleukin-1 receptor domain-containing protein [Micropruina sp. KQZ13P-5]
MELAASVFVSYNHRDANIAREVAARLTELGHRLWIDEGELRLGDSLVEAISGAIAQVDFLVAFVSPASVASSWCQKEISLAMTGEIGREGITVIPVRLERVTMPASLADKFYLDAVGKSPDDIASELNRAIQKHLAPQAPLPPRRQRQAPTRSESPYTPIRLIGIDEAGITMPRNDGTRGSALYTVPFILSRRPNLAWSELLVKNWNRPPSFTTMHRPGNGHVAGDRFVLSGTTIEEVEKYHLETLKLALDETNRQYGESIAQRRREDELRAAEQAAHEAGVREALGRLDHRFNE